MTFKVPLSFVGPHWSTQDQDELDSLRRKRREKIKDRQRIRFKSLSSEDRDFMIKLKHMAELEVRMHIDCWVAPYQEEQNLKDKRRQCDLVPEFPPNDYYDFAKDELLRLHSEAVLEEVIDGKS